MKSDSTICSLRRLLGDAGDNLPKERFQNPPLKQWENGAWYFRAYVDVVKGGAISRDRKVFTLGSMPKREALSKMREILTTINRAQYMVTSQINVGKFVEEYEALHVNRQGIGTQGKYKGHLKNHILPAFKEMMLCDLQAKLVQKWLDEKGQDTEKAKGLSWNTRTDLRNILSSMFTKAIEWQYWKEANPIQHVHVGRKRLVREKRKITDDQTRRLLAELPYDVRVLCCVCLFCTLRISEALGLQEKHLDFTRNVLMIQQRYYRGDLDQPKNQAAERELAMGHLSRDLAKFCLGDPERFVFQIETFPKYGTERALCRDDRSIHQHFLRPAAEKVGVYWKGFGFHALRREAITALNSSLGITQAMKAAGHSSADMSLLYTLADIEKQDEAMKARHEALLGKREGPLQ